MALYSTLASLSQTAASNVADGAVDAPSTIDQQTNLLASFIAQLRDGNGLTTGVGYLGQCRLSKSGSNLVLSRYNGVGLTINGVAYAIPSAGVSLAPTSLSVGTTYNIYAYMNAGTMTLEASTTAHATDSATGIEIKSGDATRTLVGMARPIAGPAWADTNAQRFVISWFNRRPINCGPLVFGSDTANAGGSSYTEILSSARSEFLMWSGDASVFRFEGSVYSNVQHAVTSTALALDGAVGESYNAAQHYQVSALMPVCVTLDVQSSVAEGYHYVTPFSKQNVVSTATYIGSGSAGARCVNQGVIQG